MSTCTHQSSTKSALGNPHAAPNEHLESRNFEGNGGGYLLDENALNMNNLKQTLLYDTKYMAEKGSKFRFLVQSTQRPYSIYSKD